MQSGFTGHVSSNEWRWVIVVSSTLVLIAFLPFLWVILNSPGGNLQFMGALHDPYEVANKLSKVTQGAQGQWLVQHLYTPEAHTGVLIDILYVLLGQIARLTQLNPIIIFHVSRVGASLFMYMALYFLGASIWMRVRTRRLFFILAAVGGGLGWLVLPLSNLPPSADLQLLPMYPFQSTLINVEWPLAIGFLSILLSALIVVLRPGNREEPSVTNGGLLVFVFSLLLSLVYPMALLPAATAFIILLLARALGRGGRGLSWRETRWLLWFIVPALPILAYDAAAFGFNRIAFEVWRQSTTFEAPSLLGLVVGLGLMLVIALPGLWRAVTKFEPDGNQFMLLWLVMMLLASYLLQIGQFAFSLGMLIPFAYFGARALEDFWFSRISRRWRMRAFVALLPLLAISHLFMVVLPLQAINRPANLQFLPRDYAFAFQWLEQEIHLQRVVLVAPEPATWLPAWSGLRVVYGSPRHTLNPMVRRQAVLDWYASGEDIDACRTLLDGEGPAADNGLDVVPDEGFRVSYVIFGPREAAIGRPACLDSLPVVRRFGEVTIHRYPLPASIEPD